MKRISLLLALLMAASLACQAHVSPRSASVPAPASDAPQGASMAELESAEVQALDAGAIGDLGFLPHAFPPVLPADESHAMAWLRLDCLVCHDKGYRGAPPVRHEDMPATLLQAKCRTCHVASVAPVGPPPPRYADPELFLSSAFPPTLPNDVAHGSAWSLRPDDCLICHGKGRAFAPQVRHQDMSRILLRGNCRSCHVPRVPAGDLDYRY